jgi:hypothetical protein
MPGDHANNSHPGLLSHTTLCPGLPMSHFSKQGANAGNEAATFNLVQRLCNSEIPAATWSIGGCIERVRTGQKVRNRRCELDRGTLDAEYRW